jgi:Zn ribbon nucleic-acid-binding protein
VTTKKPKTGGEIDSYCTKCKLDLTHRIIAMVGDEVKKVECKTCGSHHLYRKPKSERDKMLGTSKPKSAGAPKRDGEEKRPSSKAAERASAAQRDAQSSWEHAIAGQPATAFKPYRITVSFNPGELVRHPKFGDGVVARVIDRGKIEVLFKDGPKTMAHGQTI